MVERRLPIRRLTRQEFLLLGAGAGAGLALAGCGGGSQTEVQQAGSGKSYNGPKVTIAFWNGFTGGDGPYMKKLVDKFSSQQKNINVSWNTVDWTVYYQKVPSAVRAGKGPDVGIMHIDQLPTNAARQVIIPLDELTNVLNLKESDFVPEVWNAGIYGGKRYGIPLDIHPMGFYYNKGTMEKAGLDPNKPPQTKDDYMAALQQMKSKGIQGHWMSPFFFTGGMTFDALCYQHGGRLYNEDGTNATFNSQAGVDALTWMVDLVKEGYSPKDLAQDDEYDAFLNGKNAFMWNGIWNIPYLGTFKDLNWGVAPLPEIGTQRGAWSNTHQFVMMTQQDPDPNKQAASKYFINWISEHSLEWAKSGKIPARKSIRDSQAFKQAAPKEAEVTKELPYIHFPPTVPGIADVETASFDVAVNEAVLLKKSPKAALDEAAKKADDLLEENKQKYQT